MGHEMAESKPSFEEARDELIEIVAQLEKGTGSLEESVALWERGEALTQLCNAWLDETRAKLEAARERLPKA